MDPSSSSPSVDDDGSSKKIDSKAVSSDSVSSVDVALVVELSPFVKKLRKRLPKMSPKSERSRISDGLVVVASASNVVVSGSVVVV